MNIFIAESSIGSHVPALDELNAKLISFTFRPSFYSLVSEITDIVNQTSIRLKFQKALRIGGVKNPLALLSDVYSGDIIELIKDMRLKGEEGVIYLGHDNDVAGNMMASLLHVHLVARGVPEEAIYRTPLTATGYEINPDTGEMQEYLYLGFDENYPDFQLEAILDLDRQEQVKMNGENPTRYGVRKMFALDHVYSRAREYNPTVKRMSNGTSNATYMTKFTLGEKG